MAPAGNAGYDDKSLAGAEASRRYARRAEDRATTSTARTLT